MCRFMYVMEKEKLNYICWGHEHDTGNWCAVIISSIEFGAVRLILF